MSRVVLGLDVGGANLKGCVEGSCRSIPFALWRDPAGLFDGLVALTRSLPAADILAVVMTGELCDCFPLKRDGVVYILDAVERLADGRRLFIRGIDGVFHDSSAIRSTPLLAAASNWLALADWAGRLVPEGPGLLVDVGSTTSDIVPLRDGKAVPTGRTDPERLRTGELVYTGARRTPVCALAPINTAAELFATMLDVHIVLGSIDDDPGSTDTGDGRPATREYAHARLARMLGADLETSTQIERMELARAVADRQRAILCDAVEKVSLRLPELPRSVILAGSGEFLAREAVARLPATTTSLRELLGEAASAAACAYAVAVLAEEASAC